MKNLFVLLSACTLSLIQPYISEAAPKAVAAKASNMIIAQNGKTAYVITVAADAIPAEQTAATQLQDYLQQMTGARLTVKPESQVPANAPQILVGAGPRVKALLARQDWKALETDGIVLKTVGKNLILAGGRPRGSLYAVFQFLEDAGVRWWTPDVKTVPRKKLLSITPQNVTYVSPFRFREHYTAATYWKPEFATLMRENGNHHNQTPEWGSHFNLIGWCHTFTQFLPMEKYFAAHPEWFTDPNNGAKPCTAASTMPQGQNTQLCLSNPEVLDEMTKQALLLLDKEPEAGYISISQNDSDFHCTCPDCSKLAKQEGSESGPVVNFVNQVAERINQKYPETWVETLAYRRTIDPPKTIRPKGKVIIRLAPILADYGHVLNSDWNAKTRGSLLAWAKISPQLFVWNYIGNYNNSLFPFPNWEGFARDMRFFKDNKVQGIFQQGSNYTNGVGDFEPLRAWMMGKLMWNPSLDENKLRAEYLKGYYGAAAPHLAAYIDMLQAGFLKRKFALMASSRDLSFMGLEEMNQATRLFQKAQDAVKHNPVILDRVLREQLSIDLVWLIRYRTLRAAADKTGGEFLGPKDPTLALNQFYETATRFGVKYWGERNPLESQRIILEAGLAPSSPLPEFARKYPEGDIIDIQDRAIALRAVPVSSYEDDPLASDGKAVSTRGDSPEWALQAYLNNGITATDPAKWHVYAMVRASLKPGAVAKGVGLSAGVYDDTNMFHVTQQTFPLEQIATNEYRPIDLGVQTLNKYGFVWFASALNPAVDKFFVDRVILIRVTEENAAGK